MFSGTLPVLFLSLLWHCVSWKNKQANYVFHPCPVPTTPLQSIQYKQASAKALPTNVTLIYLSKEKSFKPPRATRGYKSPYHTIFKGFLKFGVFSVFSTKIRATYLATLQSKHTQLYPEVWSSLKLISTTASEPGHSLALPHLSW